MNSPSALYQSARSALRQRIITWGLNRLEQLERERLEACIGSSEQRERARRIPGHPVGDLLATIYICAVCALLLYIVLSNIFFTAPAFPIPIRVA